MTKRKPVASARLVACFCLCGVFAVAGCSRARWVEVSGKATVDGKPLTNAAVFFAPDKDNPLRAIPGGTLDGNGVYHLTTGDKKGAPVGWYKVFMDYGHKKGARVPSPVHPKYLDAAQTPLSVGIAERRGFPPTGHRSRGSDQATALRGPRRSARGWAGAGGPWCRSLCPACARVSWGSPWARPWRRVLPGACRHGGPRRVHSGAARSRLAGRGPVAEGIGS
jgi:hypothetical protein